MRDIFRRLITSILSYGYRFIDIEISIERLEFPNRKNRLRIVAISDVHAPCFYSSAIGLINIINSECPDIFILAGDIFDKKGNEHLVGMFSDVNACFAKIAVLGNWEYQGLLDLKLLRSEYERAGVQLLVNSTIDIKGLKIVGLDDMMHGTPEYQILQRKSNGSETTLVISHCPKSFDYITSFSNSPTFTISGHTHGGQVAPFGITLIKPPRSGSYLKGLYHRNKHSLYVMKGIGTNGIPLRIGAKPELLVLNIH